MAMQSFTAKFGSNNNQYWGSAAPSQSTDGTFELGDIMWNDAPAGGEAIGWICVTRGAPGTWKELQAIEA